MLTAKIAQRIADEVVESLGYNINVMNEQGVIIGSGTPARIGDFHETAMQVIRDCRIYEVSEQEASSLQGVRPGINMPILSGGEVVGVVGITGDPAQVRGIARLVKMTAELIMEQEEASYQFYMHRNDKEAFVTGLLNDAAVGHEEGLKSWADSLGYDIALPRVACVLDFGGRKQAGGLAEREAILERVKRGGLHLRQDISVNFGGYILIFKSLTDTSPWGLERQLCAYRESVCGELTPELAGAMKCFVGGYYGGIEGYHKSYKDAVRLSSRLGAGAGPVNFTHRNCVCTVYDGLPEELRARMLQPYVDRLCLEMGEGTKEIVRTAEKLIQYGFHYERAAEELFVHKNTIAFRKRKLDDCLGLDPKGNSNDLLLLALILQQYWQSEQE